MIRKKGNTYFHTSAGGFVLYKGKILLIKNYFHGGIIPAHGHVEKGEKYIETAKREICEETGYCDLKAIKNLGKAIYEYKSGRTHHHKTEYRWLFVLKNDKQKPKLDNKESKELENRWYSIDGAIRAASFENAKKDLRIIKQFLEKYPEKAKGG